MTPLLATRSNMLIAAPTATVATAWSPAWIASSAFFTNVRAADRYGRFRARRRSDTLIRFFADLLFATIYHLSIHLLWLPDTPSSGARATLR